MKSIITALLALMATLLVCAPALAEEPLTPAVIEADYQANLEYCRGHVWSDLREIQDIEFKSCVERARRVKLEMQLRICESSLRSEFEAQLLEVQASMAQLQAQLEGAGSHPTATVPVSTGNAQMSTGATFRVVEESSPVSIYNTPLPNELKLMRLGRGMLEWTPGHRQVRVVVLNHGQRMPVATSQPGQPTGFEEIYADMNNDGAPDTTPYVALDPTMYDTMYMGWKRSDEIVVWWLVPSGEYVEVQVNGQWIRKDVWVKIGPGAGYMGNTKGGAREASAQDCIRKIWQGRS